jgi:glycopeptide antibiotics resistance protein
MASASTDFRNEFFMTFLFLLFESTITFFVILSLRFKPKRNRKILYTMCIFVFVTTLFFGLQPNGYRFVNQVHLLRYGDGIAFTNIGMVYSEKMLGAIGITDSIIITAEVKPYSKNWFGRFFTIINEHGDEIFYIDQQKKNLIVSLQGERKMHPMVAGLPNALSADTIHKVTIGIGSETVWLESDKAKKITKKLPLGLQSGFLENCAILIGYSASGKNPWNGELYRLTLSNGFFRHTNDNGYAAALGTPEGLKHVRTDPRAEFLFTKSSDRRIKNNRCDSWDLIMPLFPKMFKHEWFQPLPKITPLLKNLNRHTLIDPIVNLFGFMPFGAVFLLLFSLFPQTRSKALIFTFLIALSTSTCIEFIQVFIPTRVSQMIDILLNVTGACIGAFSVRFVQWFMMSGYKSSKRAT